MVYGVWCMVYGGWITTVVIIRPSQPSLAGVGAGAELGKNDTLGSFYRCLIIFCKKYVFNKVDGSNKTKTSTWATYSLIGLKHCTISAFTLLVLHGLSRSHRLHKQINAESKLPFPNP